MCRQDIELGFVFVDDQICDSLALFLHTNADDVCRRGLQLDAGDFHFTFRVIRQVFAAHKGGVNLPEANTIFFGEIVPKQPLFKFGNRAGLPVVAYHLPPAGSFDVYKDRLQWIGYVPIRFGSESIINSLETLRIHTLRSVFNCWSQWSCMLRVLAHFIWKKPA